jgi:hypothetical protein
MPLLDALLLDPAPFNVWIAYRTDGIKGSGTSGDPYDGSTRAKFDARMSELQPNTRVHLGPGTFQTQGYTYGASGGWQIKPGMKIIGSGMEVTTLQLANHTDNATYFVIGHDISAGAKVDFAEVSDLTINCDLANAGASTACSAVCLMGNHARIHRVRAINWGSKAGNKPTSVLSCITAMPYAGVPEVADAGIEACVVVSPGASNVAVCTGISLTTADTGTEGHGKAPYIRNCFVDCGVATPNPDPATGKFRGVSMDWCRGGVVEGNHIYNCDIGGPCQEYKSNARDIIVRNNFYKNVGRGPYWNLGTFTPEVGPGALARSGTVGTVSGLSNFTYFDVGARVKIVTTPADYTGVYLVQSKTATTFTVAVPNSGTVLVEATSVRKVFGVSRAIIEGNVIELAQVSGAVALAVVDNNDSSPYSEVPDYVHGDVIVRNNKVRYVEGTAPNDSGATLMDLRGAKSVIVQNNVFDTMATLPLNNRRCGSATYFNNRTPGGVLLQGWNSDAGRKYDELETLAEDALVMSMFNER